MPAESITLNTYQHTRLSGTDNSQNEINKDKLFLKYRITFKLKKYIFKQVNVVKL